MKILLTSDLYKPSVNGVVVSLLNLEKGLKERGHDVRILTLSTSVHSYKEGNVTFIGAISAGAVYPGTRVRAALAHPLVKELEEWHPDVIHSNCEMSTFFIARKISKACRVPLVHTYHTVYEEYTHYFSPSKRIGKAVVRKLSNLIANRTSAMIAPSVKVKKLLEGYGIKTPIYVIPTGIDQTEFKGEISDERIQEIKTGLGVPEGNTVVVSIGRLAKEKNAEEIISYMKNFAGQNVTLLFVGDGPDRKNMEALASSIKEIEGQVIFAGSVDPSKVWEYYRVGDIFVSASQSETQGLTYFEALASGLPLICKQDDCLEGIVDQGVNGWQYKTEEEFCTYLRDFLDSPEKAVEMHKAALEKGEKFSVPAFAEAAEGLYKEMIKNDPLLKKKSRGSKVRIHAKAIVRKVKHNRGIKTARRVVSKIRHLRLLP